MQNQQSPYLLQHANNPVDWYPWSKEAFEQAKKENKPIFLSIGYSTCHWCHVMAHESFEDPDVAKLLNDTFICIKVDREERPDIDKIYMNICQMLTKNGGWPLTIIMTPDKKPFFAATYIPKQSQYGIKGLMTLIPEIKKIWENNTNELQQSANQITSYLQKTKPHSEELHLSQKTLDFAYEHLYKSYDKLYGGFGYQPKFPTPHNLVFLLRYWKKTGNSLCLDMVANTLEKLRMGGIYDHIGFGFHRYATDRKWILPHFEKMLYDQALLSMIYTEAYQATQKHIFKKTVEEIFEYIFRDMTSKDGGFYSAEDADSEGKEGRFYQWAYDELKQILTANEFHLVEHFYNIKKEGNYSSELEKTSNNNIFFQTTSIYDYATMQKIPPEKLQDDLESIRKKLFKKRKKRPHPEKDKKILTDWNGLMIASLAKASQVFNHKEYLEKAEVSLRFILNNMIEKNLSLIHTYQKGTAKISGFADDYAFLIWGITELYQATFKTKYLQLTIDLTHYLIDHFWDNSKGGIFFTSDTNEKLITRTKEAYDGAIPSANSITMYNLLRLSRITGNNDLEEKAKQIGRTFSLQITKNPSGYTQMMTNINSLLNTSYEIIIIGNTDKKDTQNIIQLIHSIYLPNKVIIFKEANSKDPLLEKLIPFIDNYHQINNKTTVYICKNKICQLPSTNITEIRKVLLNINKINLNNKKK